MRTKQELILKYYREGFSKRKISRELGIHRKTVNRYIRLYEKAKNRIGNETEEGLSFVNGLVGRPKYDSSKRHRRKLTEAAIVLLDEYIKQNQEKRAGGLRKQAMKKIDIWEALHIGGHDIGYTTVCNYVRGQEQKGKAAYIKQTYEPGQDCEFDWAEVKLTIGGQACRLMLAVFTSAMSNYRWAKLFWRQDMPSFQQAHVDFFSSIQGVFQRMVYDNMRVAIKRFVGRHERELTDAFLQLSAYYQFSWRFCNVGQGNEKGHVERSVEYIRRKAFSNRDNFGGLEDANAYLDQVCGGLNLRPLQGKSQSAAALFELERPRLHHCPAAYDCAELLQLRVDKYSTICCGTNHYSIPDHLVGKRPEVRLYPAYLLVYWQGQQLCRHERRRGKHGWYIQLEHYLDTLLKKPGALASSIALKTADKRLRSLFEQHFKGQPKAFIELLHYQRDKGLSLPCIEQAVAGCLKACPHQPVSLDMVKVLCSQGSVGKLQEKPATEGLIEQASKKQLDQITHLFSSQA